MVELHFKDLDFRHLLPGLLFLLLISVRFVLQKAGWWKRGHLAHPLLHDFSDRLPPASLWQRSLPGFLQALSLLFLYLAFLNPVLPLLERRLMSEGLEIALVSLEKALFSVEQHIQNVPVYSPFVQIAFAGLSLSLGLRAFRYFTQLA